MLTRITFYRLSLLLAACVLSACSPREKPGGSSPPKRRLPILQELKVELRADGLAYLPGATVPFTGDAIALHFERTPPRLHIRTPYREGKLDGVKATYTVGGKLREERSYKMGRPLTCIVYYGNGQKKLELQLNERDLGEGPYRRWHDNGVLEAESLLDANERLHGEERDYDRDGKLVAHYRNEHGVLVEAMFETPQVKADRIAKWGAKLPGDVPVQSSIR